MNLPRSTAALAALLLSFVGPALADSRDEALQAIGKCAGIAEDKARLACYDALSGRVKDALATPPSSLDREPTKDEQESWFGFDIGGLFGGGSAKPATPAEFGSERTAAVQEKREEVKAREEITSITAKLTDVAFTPFGKFIAFLDNGQVWRQLPADSDKAHFRSTPSDNEVTISRGVLGSYNLQINDSEHIYKVSRVK
ncbi:MAG TPA: hypothetical protein VIM02_12250 [Rhizomicrobium sp.]|jgi:hypothetical protein